LTVAGGDRNAGALRSWSVPSGEPRRLLSSTPFQISSGECLFELDAVAEEDLHLPVEVEMPAVLGDGDWPTNAVVTVPPSIKRAGAFAWRPHTWIRAMGVPAKLESVARSAAARLDSIVLCVAPFCTTAAFQ